MPSPSLLCSYSGFVVGRVVVRERNNKDSDGERDDDEPDTMYKLFVLSASPWFSWFVVVVE